MSQPEILVRLEQRGDEAAIAAVHEAAFGRQFEARLVEALRRSARPYLGLVAENRSGIMAHVLLTPVQCESDPQARLFGLAPMAVKPESQRLGIGSRLLRGAMSAARDTGARGVVVLGEPGFYGRFHFEPASSKQLHCAWDVPPDAFMLRPLNEPGFSGLTGLIQYHPAFDGEGIITVT